MTSYRPMFKQIFATLLILFYFQSLSAQKFTVNGYITDSLSGETLIGASLTVNTSGRGISTNAYGFYSITLEKGEYEISFSYVGYLTKTIALTLDSNLTYKCELVPESYKSDEVVVTAKRRDQNVRSAQMGQVDLSIEKIKQIPALLGEVDVLKALQLLPGVRNAGEGNSGIYIRGGGPDQNLIMLDDAVVYNPGHLFGFSLFLMAMQ
jgi:hypothetical protein